MSKDIFSSPDGIAMGSLVVRFKDNGQEVESNVYGTDRLFSDEVSKFNVIGFIMDKDGMIFGYFEEVVTDKDEFCVKVRSTKVDNATVLLPVDRVIGWFYI